MAAPGRALRVLFLAQCYAPEDVSAAVLITELAVDLARHGHEVTMVTGAPSYPQGRVFPGFRNRLLAREKRDGVHVVRTWSYISPAKSFVPRALHYLTYSATALYGGLLAGRPDVVVSYSPPLTLGISAWALSRLWRVPWVLQIEDLYPDAAIAAGVLRSPWVIAALTALERFQYRRAEHVSVIAESFARTVCAKGAPREGVSVIPVWADPDLVRPRERENAFRARHGLGGKFVVLYAGNLGLTSCLEDVVEAAALLRDDARIRFVLVGEGVRKAELEASARARGLGNVTFLPFEPRERFAEMLAAADVGLVTLNPRSAASSLPSKAFNVMASARPMLAVAPAESDLAALVARSGCGVTVAPGDAEALARAIRALQAAPEASAQMGARARAELETRFSRAGCVARYEAMLRAVCSGASAPAPAASAGEAR